MKRPILIAVIGYIIGIIVGLYFSLSIVLFYILIIAIYNLYKILSKNHLKDKNKRIKLISFKRYSRYIKINFNSYLIIIFILSSIVSNTIVILKNKQYQKIYDELSKTNELTFEGIITENKEKKKYYNRYKIKTKYNKRTISLYINSKEELNYGDKVCVIGKYIKPNIQRNYKGFDYSKYLKQLKIYGTIKSENLQIIDKKQANKIFQISNEITQKVKQKVNLIIPRQEASILLGLILGDTSEIDEDIQENFRDASMSHILAVSGMHVTYLLLGVNLIFKKIFGKRKTNIFSIIFLIFYMFLTNFSPSITRAGIMGILVLISKIIYQKNDIITSISLSLIIILIYNPFLIENLGVQLSYGGVLGIISFNRIILQIFQGIKIKNKALKYRISKNTKKVIGKIYEILSVSISAQLCIFPIILYQMNTFNPYFLISNFILSLVIGPIVILNFLFIIILLFNTSLGSLLSKVVIFSIKVLLEISQLSKLNYSKIYFVTPSIISIIIYYLIIFIFKQIYIIYSVKKLNQTQKRFRNIIALYKYKFNQKKERYVIIIILVIIFLILINYIPKNLKIYFIDVGQGDSTLIVTPTNKTILIDGGGNEFSDFDVGKNTLLPYILDRGINKIDFVFISHFDSDHVRWIILYYKRIKNWNYNCREAI